MVTPSVVLNVPVQRMPTVAEGHGAGRIAGAGRKSTATMCSGMSSTLAVKSGTGRGDDGNIGGIITNRNGYWTGAELARLLASPPYLAVIEWSPGARHDVVSVAAPPWSLSTVAVPSSVEPSKKVTVPVKTPAPAC